jgi:AcrR family transcriptional regulator
MAEMAPRKAAEKRPYHHGDLRAALLRAATDELEERGVEGFTLRSCARRAGVSHAAPAHHFGDVTGLLTAVATDAFHTLASSMRREMERTDPGSIDHVVAAGLGYVLFALDRPAEFKLMFRTERLDPESAELRAAGQSAFLIAAGSVAAYAGVDDAMADPVLSRRVIALWSLAHGMASLLLAQQLGPLGNARRLAQALLPDSVREFFGVTPTDGADDLRLIGRTSAAAAAARQG